MAWSGLVACWAPLLYSLIEPVLGVSLIDPVLGDLIEGRINPSLSAAVFSCSE